MRSLNLLVALSLAFSADCALAGDLLVDPGTGSPAFSTIQAAVNAASVGDRIFIAPGLYPERVLITKGIELVGAGPALTRVRPTQVNSFITPAQPPITIQNVPAGQRVRVSGIECSSQHNGGVLPSLPMMAIIESQGRTELSDLVLDHSSYSGTPAGVQNGTLLVFNCPQVIVERVRCTNSVQANPSTGFAGPNGMAGAFVSGSKVWFNSCELRGKGGLTIPFLPPFQTAPSGNGGDGLIAVQSEVELARTLALGSSGSAYVSLGQQPAIGGAGLRAVGSEVRLIGGAGNQLQGVVALELGPPIGVTGPAGVGAVIDAGSSLVRASDTLVAGGAGVGSQPPAPPFQVAPGGQVIDLGRRLPSLQLTPGRVQIGQPVTVDYQGEPNSVHLRALWVSSGPALPLPGIGGRLLLDPLTLVQTLPVVLDTAGQTQVQSGIPNNPNYLGLCLVEQSAQVAGFDIDLGAPAILNVDF